MDQNTAVIIVGGGLAGLTAAIHLSKIGLQVLLIEKNDFPKHKVCGEYISNEVLPYFNWLGVDINSLNPTSLTHLDFSIQSGNTIHCELPQGGFGVSRYALDNFLYKKALSNGCIVLQEEVLTIEFVEKEFVVTTASKKVFKANLVLGAYGKRAAMDQKLNRNFIKKKSPWLAVKAHYSGEFPNNLVGLHNFEGGYCGVSKVENNHINVCYLADYKTFKKFKNIEEYQKEIVGKNPHLKHFFDNFKMIFDKPLTISQISFAEKKTVENHILMIGDTTGLIHPLCGNGMAMAIHSAKIVSELIECYFIGKIKSRADLEYLYSKKWNTNFKNRMRIGRMLATILQKPKLTAVVMRILIKAPFLLPIIIKHTHGKPLITKH